MNRNDTTERTGTERIYGSGEMADLIRTYDWAGTSLGAIKTWRAELVMAVNMMLSSKVISALFWGPEQVLLYNDLYRPHLGSKHPALGRPLQEIWGEVYEQVTPLLVTPFHTGVAPLTQQVTVQVLLDGELVERTYTTDVVPLRGESPEGSVVLGLYQTAIDETESVQTARNLRTSETQRDRLVGEKKLFHTLVESSQDFICMCDLQGTPFYGNPAAWKLIGLDSLEEFNRTNLSEFFFPEDREHLLAEFLPAVVRDGHAQMEVRFRHRQTGEAIPMSYQVFLLEDENGRPFGFGTVSRDLTQEKQTTEVLLRTEKLAAVGRLASSIAHEINNPLESVTNLLYIIRHSDSLEAIHDYVDTAERELRRVSLIANQTLRFHKQSTSASAFFCYDLIGDSLAIYQGRIVNQGIRVEKRKRAEHPVTCLGGEIRQVLSNLIGNAIDAMPMGGRLILRSREATDGKTGRRGVVLTVADTGTGISPATQKRIFEPFFTTKGIGGTGLGLWLSSEIVVRHHGSLRVRSCQAEGASGTVFTLFLPFDEIPDESVAV